MADASTTRNAVHFDTRAERIPMAAVIPRLDAAIASIGSEYRVHPQSRVFQYRNLLAKHFARPGPPTERTEIEAHVVARREVEQLDFIFRTLSTPPEPAGWRKLMAEAFTGPIEPSVGTDQPRDAQAELYGAATVRRAGLVATLEEPDVIAHWNGQRFGFAVKRPRTVDAIPDNFRKGIKQLASHRVHGAVLLDLTFALSEATKFYDVEDLVRGSNEIRGRVVTQLTAAAPRIDLNRLFQASTGGDFLVGVTTIVHTAMRVPTTGHIALLHILIDGLVVAPESPSVEIYRALNAGLLGNLPPTG